MFHGCRSYSPRPSIRILIAKKAAGIAACLGAEPAVILQAAEIGIESVPLLPKRIQ
jgi:hypothetical protein